MVCWPGGLEVSWVTGLLGSSHLMSVRAFHGFARSESGKLTVCGGFQSTRGGGVASSWNLLEAPRRHLGGSGLRRETLGLAAISCSTPPRRPLPTADRTEARPRSQEVKPIGSRPALTMKPWRARRRARRRRRKECRWRGGLARRRYRGVKLPCRMGREALGFEPRSPRSDEACASSESVRSSES